MNSRRHSLATNHRFPSTTTLATKLSIPSIRPFFSPRNNNALSLYLTTIQMSEHPLLYNHLFKNFFGPVTILPTVSAAINPCLPRIAVVLHIGSWQCFQQVQYFRRKFWMSLCLLWKRVQINNCNGNCCCYCRN